MADDADTTAGFRFEGSQLKVSLPACIRVHHALPIAASSDGAQADVVALFRVLRQYHLEEQSERTTHRQERGLQRPIVTADSASLHWIECVLELLDDFQQRGLLRYNRRVATRVTRGRIDWRTTIRREVACVSQNNILYLAPFRFAVEAHEHHPLTELHRETICHLYDLFGGALAGERPAPTDTRISRSVAGRILAQERNRVFRDRDRRVMYLLAQYWLASPAGRLRGIGGDLLWTEQFEFIWQRMAERVIGSRHAQPNGMPRGQYQEIGNAACPGLSLRPDLVVDVAHQAGVIRVVFDAKYYTSQRLPSSHDILKQLAYSYFSSSRWHGALPEQVLNIFLLPAQSLLEPIQLCGRHQLLGLEAEQRGRPLSDNIWLFRIDYRALASAYLAGEAWDASEFVEKIRHAEGTPSGRS